MTSSVAAPTFLSVRMPAAQRNRIKSAAAARGQSVQDLVGELVFRFLAEQDRHPPVLGEIIARLRDEEQGLRDRGVASLWVFGSVARGEAGSVSDIDMAVTFEPQARISLTGLATLRSDLAAMLGAPVDLAEWNNLRPDIRDQARRDAVRLF